MLIHSIALWVVMVMGKVIFIHSVASCVGNKLVDVMIFALVFLKW
jgi:hypothetical protein